MEAQLWNHSFYFFSIADIIRTFLIYYFSLSCLFKLHVLLLVGRYILLVIQTVDFPLKKNSLVQKESIFIWKTKLFYFKFAYFVTVNIFCRKLVFFIAFFGARSSFSSSYYVCISTVIIFWFIIKVAMIKKTFHTHD